MKNVIFFAFTVFFAVNILAGLLLNCYHTFNVIATNVSLLTTAALMYAVARVPLKTAFRVPLTFTFAIIGVASYLLMLFSRHQIQDNWCLIVALVLLALEATILYITYCVNKNTN